MSKLLVNQVVMIYYPSKEMELEKLTCKVIGETVNTVQVEYVDPKAFEMKQRMLAKDEVIRGMEEHKDVQTKEMSCQEYLDKLWNESHFDEMIQDMKFRRDYSSNTMFRDMLYSAQADGVHLKDVNDFDYDKEMQDCYDSWQL
jgi:hypothetical protein